MRKPAIYICINKDADQLHGYHAAYLAFVFATQIVQSLYFLNPNFKPLAIFCGCAAWFVSVKVGDQKTSLVMTQLMMSTINALCDSLMFSDQMSASQILADIDTVQFDQSTKVQPQLENMTDNVYYGM